MLGTFGSLATHLKLKSQTYQIDNWIFKLHYRITFVVLLASTILVCSRQYIGEHIHCIADGGVPGHVMNTFCFFTTTFTVIKDLDARLLDTGNLPHPGVGPYGINSKEDIRRHAYYQWVPFVLFGQAIMFYLTHMLWKKLEGGRLKYLVEGLQLAAYAFEDKNIQVQGKSIPTKNEKMEKIKSVRETFLQRIYIRSSWSAGLILCEALNVLNVVLQFYITNKFLGGQFSTLGSDIWREGLESSVDPLEEVFPKVTKCTFYKYGPSGSIQLHDAMCVMALNIVNEKIYTFLWFWFIILFICSCTVLLWRLVTVYLHSKSKTFNKMVFANTCPGKLNPWDVLTVSRHCSYTDWIFLKYLAKNVDGMVFREIMVGLAEELDKSEKETLLPSESKTENEYKLE